MAAHGDIANWLSVIEASTQSGYHPEHVRKLLRRNMTLLQDGFEPLFHAIKKANIWLIETESFSQYCRQMKQLGTAKHDPTRIPRRR